MKEPMRFFLLSLLLIFFTADAPAAITKQEFSEVSKEFIKFIVPFGQRWDPSYTRSINLVPDSSFGAFSTEPITVNQGLIDDPSMTKDGLALILCHEVGHNVELARFALGGELRYAFSHLEQDYFAVHACLFPYFTSSAKVLPGIVTEPEVIPRTLFTRCQSFNTDDGIRDCLRAIRASQKLSDALYDYFERSHFPTKFPRPSLSREWMGPRDELQARLVNFINGIFGELPFVEKSTQSNSAQPI